MRHQKMLLLLLPKPLRLLLQLLRHLILHLTRLQQLLQLQSLLRLETFLL